MLSRTCFLILSASFVLQVFESAATSHNGRTHFSKKNAKTFPLFVANQKSLTTPLVVTFSQLQNIHPSRINKKKTGVLHYFPAKRLLKKFSLPSIHLKSDENGDIVEKQGTEKDTGPKNKSTAKNEFSRTVRVSRWFSGSGSASNYSGGRSSNKSLNLSIHATPLERNALASRFRLSNIASLSADLVVEPAFELGVSGIGGRGSGNRSYGDNNCIEARGTVRAKVTQSCVRTNEDFDVDLEFSFDTILRAVMDSNDGEALRLSNGEAAALEAASKWESDDGSYGGSRNRKGKKQGPKRRSKRVKGSQSLNELDAAGMKQLQDILMGSEVTDEIIEDGSCFCSDGIVDVGEIVAQIFRSKLDPFPKKPGSDPVRYTFTF